MKTYKSQAEVEADIKDGVLTVVGNVEFKGSINIAASITVNAGNITARDITARDITARDITARDITAWDITAWDITAGNINAGNITAENITAGNITAWDINAWNINAWDINARDINAENITAREILYYAFCCVYKSISCLSIKAKRERAHPPVCLEGKLEIKS